MTMANNCLLVAEFGLIQKEPEDSAPPAFGYLLRSLSTAPFSIVPTSFSSPSGSQARPPPPALFRRGPEGVPQSFPTGTRRLGPRTGTGRLKRSYLFPVRRGKAELSAHAPPLKKFPFLFLLDLVFFCFILLPFKNKVLSKERR